MEIVLGGAEVHGSSRPGKLEVGGYGGAMELRPRG